MVITPSILFFSAGLALGTMAGCTGAICINRLRKSGKQAHDEDEIKSAEKIVSEILNQDQEHRTKPEYKPSTEVMPAWVEELSAPQVAQKDKTPIEIPSTRDEEKPCTLQELFDTEATCDISHFDTSEMRKIARTIDNEDLSLLLLDRMDEIDEKNSLDAQALCAVSLTDEIMQMCEAYEGQNAAALSSIHARLLGELARHNCEIINSDTWNPEVQKIGKVEYTLEDGASPHIAEKLASGLRMNGRILRKQLVALNKSRKEQ